MSPVCVCVCVRVRVRVCVSVSVHLCVSDMLWFVFSFDIIIMNRYPPHAVMVHAGSSTSLLINSDL